MADITNAEAVRFCNDKLREQANKLAQAYYGAKAVRDEWYANDMGKVFPADGGVVVDGAANDGRHPLSRNSVLLLINRCEDLIADMEAGGNAKLNTVLAVATHPTRD